MMIVCSPRVLHASLFDRAESPACSHTSGKPLDDSLPLFKVGIITVGGGNVSVVLRGYKDSCSVVRVVVLDERLEGCSRCATRADSAF